jgi:UDP-N-acetylglucosamine 2-epimerase (non-hydrolysing)
MAPLVLKLKQDERFEEITVVSAQHREMLDQVLDIFKSNLIMILILCTKIKLWKILLQRY